MESQFTAVANEVIHWSTIVQTEHDLSAPIIPEIFIYSFGNYELQALSA